MIFDEMNILNEVVKKPKKNSDLHMDIQRLKMVFSCY